MRKLSQKELIDEGIGTFMKKVGKGAGVVAGRALKGLAKSISPTATGVVQKASGAISDTVKAVKSAITTPEEKIRNHFEEFYGYSVKAINPGVSDDTKVVKVSEIVYDDNGKGTEQPIATPFVVKLKDDRVKVVRGPSRRNPGVYKDNNKQKEAPKEPPAAQAAAPPAAQAAAPPAPPATGARGTKGPRGTKSESPGAARKRIARALQSNRPPSKGDIEMLKKAGVKGNQTIGGVTLKNLARRKNLAEKNKSQKNLLKHLHSGSQMNK